MLGLSVNRFWQMRPKLPFRFKAEFFTGNEQLDKMLGISLTNITLPKMEGQASEGSLYLGNTIYTIPVWKIGSRKLEITFEETDKMVISKFIDRDLYLSYGQSPYRISIGIHQFDENLYYSTKQNDQDKDKSKYQSTLYICHLSSYSEPQFKRSGNANQVTMTATFIIDAEIRNWDGTSNIVIGQVNANEISEYNQQITKDDFGVTYNDSFEKNYISGKDNSQTGSTGSSVKYPKKGQKIAGKGAVGSADLKVIQAAGAAEIYGFNGMGRKEGTKNAVYFNSKDEGKQAGKLNFGAGNTQVFLEGTELKNTKITITNTKTGETLTGTMDELTKKLKGKGDANSTQSAWVMDDVSAQKVEDIALGKTAKAVQNNIDAEILAAMDTDVLGGIFHQEYGSGGSTKYVGDWMKKNKAAVLADLKANNGKFSNEFAEKMAQELGKNIRKETKNSYVDRTVYYTGTTGYAVSHKTA